ncbi:MAG: nicotinate-nucleotide adenylyltransferase [Flavobacteriaceae bacterium]|nr:nicotinate-nucleotide adenylyltransferase [Flavobacteriaceae bacterium]
MKKLMLWLLVFGLTTQFYAQVVNDGQLPEIEVKAINYKYLNDVNSSDVDLNVKSLELEVANFDPRDRKDLFEDEYSYYKVSFYIPDGMIVAAYDDNGKIIRTIEKFKDVKPPRTVINSVAKRFPRWVITDDVYKVTYHHKKGSNKTYNLILKNGERKMRVKTDENGRFL